MLFDGRYNPTISEIAVHLKTTPKEVMIWLQKCDGEIKDGRFIDSSTPIFTGDADERVAE